MKAYVQGTGDTDQVILTHGTRWRWQVSFMSRLLHSSTKSHRLSLNMRLGGSQNRPRYSGQKLIYPCPEKK